MINSLHLQIEEFFSKLQNGDFDDRPYSLAAALEVLANLAWDEVDCQVAVSPPSLMIE